MAKQGMIERRDDGRLRLSGGVFGNVLALSYWHRERWHELPLTGGTNGRFRGSGDGPGDRVRIELAIEHDEGVGFRYRLALESGFPTRVQVRLSVGGARNPFHLIPCCIYGDNNLSHAEPGHFPNLTHDFSDSPSCAPCWELRADRSSHPVSMVLFDGGLAAVSIDPYSPVDPAFTTSREGFVRNGLFSALGAFGGDGGNGDNMGPACGATLGYRNDPVSFINKDTWGIPTEHLLTKAEVSGRIFLSVASGRLAAHGVIRKLYSEIHEPAVATLSGEQSIHALTEAFLTVNWQNPQRLFSNMRCDDSFRKHLTAWRTLPEIGWTGGGVVAYPLLVSGLLSGRKLAVGRAMYLYDLVAGAFNEESGLLWDVARPVGSAGEGVRMTVRSASTSPGTVRSELEWAVEHSTDGWWAGYLVKGVHCAYTNGSGLYYLLKGYGFLKERGAAVGEAAPASWLATATRALDTVCRLQEGSGNFGYTYSIHEPAVVDREGFAGVWFVPALALAHRFTGDTRYLDAARRGIEYYRSFVRDLSCWGTPMDTWKSPEEEGNLGFIRGAHLLHEITGEQAFLEMLAEGAEYEYLWRYAYRARPEYAPLKASSFNSCGGSVTSVSNPHIHPMAMYLATELGYLAEHSADSYHRMRRQDGIDWARNIIGLYPRETGYGVPGVLTERYCPSDGLTIETFSDGTPSSMWFSYNGWAAASALEGLAEVELAARERERHA